MSSGFSAVSRHHQPARMNKDNLTNLVCRNLAFAVAHQIRQIDRLRQIRIDYGQRWIDNSDYSK
ncbi:hypothetical protein ACFL1W_01540, partial [Candidatus Margulisiibacteriota bacterium]